MLNKAKLKDLQKELDLYKKHLKDNRIDAPTTADIEAAKKANTQ